MKPYDYIIVGSGIYGATFAFKARDAGKRVLILERLAHAGGHIFCKEIEGINIHVYGAHIFHTSNKEAWDFVNKFVEFNRYTNSPIANYKGKLYNLPFNMNTFHTLWGINTPAEAQAKIEEQRREANITEPRNLEEQAISLVGKDIYEILIKGYTEKQWGRPCSELPAFIIKRLPVRFTYDNNYFDDCYQGIPIGGYNKLIDGLLKDIEVRCNIDYLENREYWNNQAETIIYSGPVDAFYNFCFGTLEYRNLGFEHKILDTPNFQGNAVINYTEREVPYTRIIEHKHFEFGTQKKTVITYEYPREWTPGSEPYYPINDEKNSILYARYKELADKEDHVIFGGRLGMYKYWNMNQVVEEVLKMEIWKK